MKINFLDKKAKIKKYIKIKTRIILTTYLPHFSYYPQIVNIKIKKSFLYIYHTRNQKLFSL